MGYDNTMSKKKVYVVRCHAFVLADRCPNSNQEIAALLQSIEDCADTSSVNLKLEDIEEFSENDLEYYVPYEFTEDGDPVSTSTHSVLTHLQLADNVRHRSRLVDNLRDTLGANDYTSEDVELICKAVSYSESEQVTKPIAEQIKSNKTS